LLRCSVMRRSSIAGALRSAVLAALTVPALVSCGGSGQTVDAGPLAGNLGCAAKKMDGGSAVGVISLCTRTYPLVGYASSCDPDDAGELTASQCDALCAPQIPASCSVYDDFSESYVSCFFGPCGIGRRPQGLTAARASFGGATETARFLAETAYLEAASVGAFERLARELRAHGAPRRLCDASRRAARDEIRHARVTKELAERAGGTVPQARVEPRSVRSLEEIAIENAVEGCVRETFGAAIGMMQAAQAGDLHVRRAMKPIARDEARHAQLAWAVAAWLEKKLDAQGRARVREAQASAVEALMREAGFEPDATLIQPLGIPNAAQARVALGKLQASLWSRAA
jgi:hypothetical protein